MGQVEVEAFGQRLLRKNSILSMAFVQVLGLGKRE